MPSMNNQFIDSQNESTLKPTTYPFFIGAPVRVTQEASHHDRPFERETVGMIGQVVDFGHPQDYDNIIVSFPDLEDFGGYNSCHLELVNQGEGI